MAIVPRLLAATSVFVLLFESCIAQQTCPLYYCENGGSCRVTGGSGGTGPGSDLTCDCAPMWEGLRCEMAAVICPPGSSSSTGFTPCQLCEKDMYQPSWGSTFCIECPLGTKTDDVGAVTEDECKVPPPPPSTTTTLVATTSDTSVTISDPCSIQTACAYDAPCFVVNNVAYCDCTGTGYGGKDCTDDPTMDPCIVNNPCEHGLCYIDGGTPSCYCHNTGYEGMSCEILINEECRTDTCMNGGTCKDSQGSVDCDCTPGYTGRYCQDIDENPPPPPSVESLTTTLIIVIAIAVAVVVIAIIIVCIVCICCRRDRGQTGESDRQEIELHSTNTYAPAMRKTQKKGCFDRKSLTFFEQLGSGAFAVVYRAKANSLMKKGVETVVAVKMLKESATEDDKSNFLKEVEMYKNLKPHPNVINMLASCIEKEPFYIIMEFASQGDLHSHLQKIRTEKQIVYANDMKSQTDQQFLAPSEILSFAVQIARGMTYLASQKCVHRDLATRNILLGDKFICKVSDFGLARDVTEGNEYEMKSRGRVPLRWMALESLLQNMFSAQSDVWSFGIVLWELVTLGSHPYPGMSGSKIISDLERGYRLPKPEHCSNEIYELMKSCWEEVPDRRPTFSDVLRKLEVMLDDASGYLVMTAFQENNYVYLQPDQEALDD